MKPAFYWKRWSTLKGKANKDQLSQFARQIALSFLDRYFYNDRHEEEYIRLLCEMATHFDDEALNQAGSFALFSIVIEGLCDDFEELQTEAYNKVMSQVVDFCRTIPAGKELSDRLKDFVLESYQDILDRIERIRAYSDESKGIESPPEKIFLLSRVTVGADVAITSVLIQRLYRIFPEAEIVVIGGGKLNDIFGSNPHIRIAEVNYSRHGNIIERFSSWFAVLDTVNREIIKADSDNIVVVDPDSRLSQLGVLPLVSDRKYMFFNSRGKDTYPKKMSIAELTNHWVDRVLGESEFCYPMVWLKDSIQDKASHFSLGVREAGCKQLIVINLGVGGNSRKRLGGNFEEKLILKLLQEPDTVVVLDRGFGEEEFQRTGALVRAAEENGFTTASVEFNRIDHMKISSGVVGVVAGIGEIAALISQCDEFIGYDSACQHIAASLGVSTYTVFAGSNNPRFIRRWSACGPSKSEIIHVDTLTHPTMFDTDDILVRIIDARSE